MITLNQQDLNNFLGTIKCFGPKLLDIAINYELADKKCDINKYVYYITKGYEILSDYKIGFYNDMTQDEFYTIYNNMRKIYLKYKE